MLDRSSLLVILLLAACKAGGGTPDPDRVILGPGAASALLKQCSRDTPSPGEGSRQPTDADVDAVEKVLPTALVRSHQAQGVDFTDLLERWQRQYVGLRRNGKRYIYANYFPAESMNELADWRNQPMIVCDGGPRFFGAEYDSEAGKLTRIDFNGSVGG